ncbi:MAG: CPBP family intramembrane metalloprotease [Bacteroidaceae bacterium]|nr:CPBP family intramembrane metalloprotease [Bacteroidaceae bacterium]
MHSQCVRLILALAIAAVLWFVMFSPWTAGHVNFWYTMTFSGAILIVLSLFLTQCGSLPALRGGEMLRTFILGLLIASVLWMVFFIGDKVSQLMFTFARPQVDGIYDMKADASPVYIAFALLLVIGPAEEIFWRGYIQRELQARLGDNNGFVVATLAYTMIHIWSFNFMLIMAALVCGICWGGLYRLRPQWLPALIVSHALWDTAAFVVFPF